MKRMPKARLLLIIGASLGALSLAPSALGAAFYYERQNSTINGRIKYSANSGTIVSPWYRAGSGNGGTQECVTNNWIPTGQHNVQAHYDNYNGTQIKGRVWWMNDIPCGGNVRTQMFVHSEETSSQGQDPNNEPFRWDGDSDYYSFGCIKVARLPVVNGYSDLGRLDTTWVHQSGGGSVGAVIVSP